MEWQQTQCVFSQPPVLPSFSQLVTILGQPHRPVPLEPRLTFDNGYPHPSRLPLPSPAFSSTSRYSGDRSPAQRQVDTPVWSDVHHVTLQGSSLPSPDIISSHPSPKAEYPFTITTRYESQPSLRREPEAERYTSVQLPTKRQRKDRNQPMDPHVTRDGNPRKRLAQACERCRAQKIKCRLRGSACNLCIKQGLECQFAARSYRSNATKVGSSVDTTGSPCNSQLDDGSSRGRICEISGSERAPTSGTSRADSSHLPDTLQTGPNQNTPSQPLCKLPSSAKTSGPMLSTQARGLLASDDLSIDIDPYLFDADLSQHYVEQYFTHLNSSPYYLLPKAPFMDWIASSGKSSTEKILLYAIMAAGAIFSTHRDHDTHLLLFTKIARDGLQGCSTLFEMPVVHTLLILSTVSGHLVELQDASSDSVCALRCAYGLQLNQETAYPTSNDDLPYLTTSQVAECCRRTFWLAYIRSSVWTMFNESPNQNPVLQGNLRLPCSDTIYETGRSSDVPVAGLCSTKGGYDALLGKSHQPQSHLSLLVEAIVILENSKRHESSQNAMLGTEQEQHAVGSRLLIDDDIRLWRRRRDTSLLAVSGSMPWELQVMDKCMSIISRRNLKQDALRPTQARDHFQQTRHAATQLLEVFQGSQSDRKRTSTATGSTDPFMSCMLFMAFDVFTAAGILSSVLDRRESSTSGRPTFMSLTTGAIMAMSDMAEHSKLAGTHLRAMQKRLAAVMTQSNTAEAWRGHGFYFTEPLCSSDRRWDDIVYDMSASGIADALGLGDNENDMLEMRLPSDEL